MKNNMSESVPSDSNSPIADDDQSIKWSCHPVKRRPLLSVGITLLVLFIIAMVFNTTQSLFFGLLAFIIMFVSLAKFYFPTHYRLSENEVTVKTTTQTLTKNWSEFRSFYPDKNGILLSPFAQPSKLENFRGLFIMFNENSAAVTAFVKNHISTSVESSDRETN